MSTTTKKHKPKRRLAQRPRLNEATHRRFDRWRKQGATVAECIERTTEHADKTNFNPANTPHLAEIDRLKTLYPWRSYQSIFAQVCGMTRKPKSTKE